MRTKISRLSPKHMQICNRLGAHAAERLVLPVVISPANRISSAHLPLFIASGRFSLVCTTTMSRKMQRVASSKQNPLTLRNLSTLADVLKDEGRLNEAAEFYRKGLEGREEVLGVDHPSTLEVVNSLALLLEVKRSFDESEEMFKRAFEGRKKMLGEYHIQTCDTAFNLADLYRKLNRIEPAIEMYQHALQGYSKYLGNEHNNTVVTIQRLDELQALQAQQCHCVIS